MVNILDESWLQLLNVRVYLVQQLKRQFIQ